MMLYGSEAGFTHRLLIPLLFDDGTFILAGAEVDHVTVAVRDVCCVIWRAASKLLKPTARSMHGETQSISSTTGMPATSIISGCAACDGARPSGRRYCKKAARSNSSSRSGR